MYLALRIFKKRSKDVYKRRNAEATLLIGKRQKAGRTNELIITHQTQNLELLVFFRKKV